MRIESEKSQCKFERQTWPAGNYCILKYGESCPASTICKTYQMHQYDQYSIICESVLPCHHLLVFTVHFSYAEKFKLFKIFTFLEYY